MTRSICAIAFLLTGCWHAAFHTSIENGTNEKIYVVIRFNDHKKLPGYGDLEAGGTVNLTERIQDISYIEYKIRDHQCRMDSHTLGAESHLDEQGLTKITLYDCVEKR